MLRLSLRVSGFGFVINVGVELVASQDFHFVKLVVISVQFGSECSAFGRLPFTVFFEFLLRFGYVDWGFVERELGAF